MSLESLFQVSVKYRKRLHRYLRNYLLNGGGCEIVNVRNNLNFLIPYYFSLFAFHLIFFF